MNKNNFEDCREPCFYEMEDYVNDVFYYSYMDLLLLEGLFCE